MDLLEKIIAGIVLYNPDMIRLKENLDAISTQADEIVCIDNASLNIKDIEELVIHFPKIKLIKNANNMGIATALNQIITYADEQNYKWVLTLDQDSIVDDNLITVYKLYLDKENMAMLTCLIQERTIDSKEYNQKKDIVEVNKCITSGCLTNVKACIQTGYFKDSLFIDYVDFDMCIRLIQKGWKIYCVNYVGLLHQTGQAQRVKVFGRDLYLKGHPVEIYHESPIRIYYFFRNVVYFWRRYGLKGRDYTSVMHILWRALLVIWYEHPKRIKVIQIIKGIRDGWRMKI